MAFQENKKRRTLVAPDNVVPPETTVTPISIEAMVLSFGGKKAYFKRLQFWGCPTTLRGKNGAMPANALDMCRSEFLSDMYDLFKGFDANSRSGFVHFVQLTQYVGALDRHDRSVNFCENNVLWYFSYKRSQMLKGEITKGTLICVKSSISALLRSMGNIALSRKIPAVKKQRASITPYSTLSDSELTAVGRKLMTSYMAYSRLVLNDETPHLCLLFNEEELRGKGFNAEEIACFEKRAKTRVCNGNWRNQATRLAFMIISMWTGANLTPLAKLSRRDAIFHKGNGDTYEFNSTKARALYSQQKLGFGFVKRTKLFIENWLIVSAKFASGDDDPLFPFLGRNGQLNPDSQIYLAPHKAINEAITSYGYPKITTSIFRKTRSNALMRAFNDVFVVADANKSSADTVSKSYLHGVKEAHEIQLAGAFVAQENMAFGIPKKLAIENANYKFKDPLTEFEWSRNKKTIPNKTPTGIRCQEPFGVRAKRSLIALKDLSSSDDGACIDFLGCFECEHHALIAEKDDIWLMLSFKDSIIETMARPSISSVPSTNLEKTLNTVNSILPRYNAVAPDEYQAALALNKKSPHPLYDDESALTDLLEVYK